MKVDLSQDGLPMFFKDWQIPIINELLSKAQEWKTAEVYEYVNGLLPEGRSISRASVIFFLRDMAEENLFEYKEETGKGGHHRVYWGVMTVPEFLECARCKFNEKIDEMLGNE